MNVSVVVPYTPGQPERDRNWTWLRARYEHCHPHWELVTRPDPGPGAWSKGRTLRAAVQHASNELLVLADADVFVGVDVLRAAVVLVRQGAPWAMPHHIVYRLSELQTGHIVSHPPDVDPKPLPPALLERRRHPAIRGGGIVVTTRVAFDRVGGIDPRFTDWGGEDISFARALDTLVGPARTLRAPMWHLHHPRMPRLPGNRAKPENEALAGAYKDADGDPRRMTELVKDAR